MPSLRPLLNTLSALLLLWEAIQCLTSQQLEALIARLEAEERRYEHKPDALGQPRVVLVPKAPVADVIPALRAAASELAAKDVEIAELRGTLEDFGAESVALHRDRERHEAKLTATHEALRQCVEVMTAMQDRVLPEDLRPAFDAALEAGRAAVERA